MPRADVALASDVPAGPLALMGRSAAAQRLADDIRAAADASCVLIEAEAGFDPAEIAREIHTRGARAGAFVAVECGAAEPALVERHLFGESSRRPSRDLESIAPRSALALARTGTLFLGDLSELSASAQSRLARVARDGEVRIGGGVACHLDVRLIAATSADLMADVEEGRLRRELMRHFARTRVVVPPLRRRADDLPLLIAALIATLADHAGTAPKALTQPALTLLSAMPWRGNLAELRRAVARLMADVSGNVIQLEDVLAHVRFDGAMASQAPSGSLRAARQQFERDYITLVLQHHGWRVGDAARALGIQRTNLYRKARQLGISVARPVHHS